MEALDFEVEQPKGWPRILCKAMQDEFEYEVSLLDGTRIRFCGALKSLEGFALLTNIEQVFQCGQEIYSRELRPSSQNRIYERGIEIRLDSICWLSDAPRGS